MRGRSGQGRGSGGLARNVTAFLALCALWWVMSAGATWAHFLLNVNLRVIHVEHLDEGLRVYIRLPMPLVIADLVGPEAPDGTKAPAPYTYNRFEDGKLMHYLDIEALRQDPIGLGQLIADGHGLFLKGGRLPWRVEAVRAYPALEQTRFTTLEEVHATMEGPVFAGKQEEIYVGEIVLDAQIFIPTAEPAPHYWFASRLMPELKGIDQLANMLIDHYGGEAQRHRAIGVLERPIEVSRAGVVPARPAAPEPSWAEAVAAFIWQGVRHILQGPDHVLFVLCLTVGALGLTNLLWRVTGFTLGHTVALIAGFFGFVPAGAWFVPTIEAAIALSIIYAGVVALLRRAAAATFVLTAAIGVLHGFGFSFVLHTILQVDSPTLWSSLISFNVGVEIGQFAIIVAVWPLLMLGERYSVRYARYSRIAVAVPCIAVALFWTVERVGIVWEKTML